MMGQAKLRPLPMLSAFAAAIVIMGLGGALTMLGPWWQALKVPAWKPPDWAFGPAWTIIFVLWALAAALAWQAARSPSERRNIVLLFGLNGLLNVAWSGLFFGLQRPDWALVEVIVFWASIAALILAVRPIARPAAIMLLPYLVWVTFAAAVNLSIVRLNPSLAASVFGFMA